MAMSEGAGAAKRILVVEDSMIIALDAEECLLGLGAEEVVVVDTVAGALAALAAQPFDCAVLDFNLGSESSDPVATDLRARGIPFWLATGYSEMAGDLGMLGARGVLVKPYGRAELASMMAEFAALSS
jgi:CheY-like chemotaxis protein